MATLDWELATADEVTLVHAAVRTEARRAVRIANELDGPVWPPRTQGRPAPGWRDDAYVGVSGPERPLVVGYASPAPPAEPPVSLDTAPPPAGEVGAGAAAAVTTVDGAAADTAVADSPAADSAAAGSAAGATTGAVVRALGPAGPPRSAVPQIAAVGGEGGTRRASTGDGAASDPEGTEASDPGQESCPPDAVATWLDDVAARTSHNDGAEANATRTRTALETVRERCDGLLERIDGRTEPARRPARGR